MVSLQYTFKDWDKKDGRECALLEFSGTISNIPDSSQASQKEVIAIREGTSSGKTWIEKETGLTVDSTNDQNIIVDIITRIPLPTGVREQKATITVNQKINLKLVDSGYSQ